LIIRRLTSSGLLLLVLAGCNGKDTNPSDRWPRAVEPRLSVGTAWHPCQHILRPGHLIADSVCASESGLTTCDRDIVDGGAAREAVALRTPCLDRAIEYLQKASRRNGSALTDLAAAYYVRAQRGDRVSDLLRALNAAEEAAAVRPAPLGAHFNQGLILESLGLNQKAIAAWTLAAADEKGDWAREARAHRDALANTVSKTRHQRWELAKDEIANAIAKNDERAIEAIIKPFPLPAKDYFEDTLLRAWAGDPSPTSFARLRTFATALSKTNRDNYATDVVAAIDRGMRSPASLAGLEVGSAKLEAAHDLNKALDVDAAAPVYRAAADLLKRAGSPLYLEAEMGRAATTLNLEGKNERDGLPAFREIERVARSRGYARVEVSARANAAYALSKKDRNIEALAEYDDALAFYQHAGDWEGQASIQARRTGVLGLLGQYEDALRAALPYVRDAANVVDFKSHHLLIGETAAIATLIGCPRSAFALLDSAVRHFDDELKEAPPEDRALIRAAESHIAFARENRAAAELRLGKYREAESDLTQAVRLQGKDSEAVSRRKALDAQLDEIEGMTLLDTNPNAAAAELAKAAALDDDEYTSFRVAVLVEEAQALRKAGRRAEADDVLREAVDRIAREEAGTLAQRKLHGDPVWNGYFDRFRNAYDLLIQQVVEERETAEGFAYNEQSHALEPLDLILKSGFAAPEVKVLASADPKTLLPDIQSHLPADTYIVEYRVMEDATYAWVVSRDAAPLLTLQPGRSEVERWTTTLQRAASDGDGATFAKNLYAPYDRLIRPVLAAIRMTDKTRLVFVPDEFMHALPFAALHDPNSHRYLIEQATLSISGSAKLYVSSLLRDRALKQSNGATALLVGDPAFDPRYGRGALPLHAARNEVQALRSLYEPRVKELVGDDATVPRFLQAARRSQIIDIAAHAITDGEAPTQSFLLLTPSANDTGVLDAQRLLTALRLENTRLVVLGACRSGGSATVGPQGVAPLVRPFLAAGVPGVVGTLWDINDATAKEVLVSFHRHYQQVDAAAALRAAQIDLLRTTNPGLSSELTWAGYEVIGYASSPFASAGEMKKEKPPP
jgi:CHAT domain-containing protein